MAVSKAPTSFEEAAHGILLALSSAMTAPDAGPHLQFLTEMQQAVVGQVHMGKGGPGAQGGQPPGMAGGGSSLGQLQGRPASPPTAGPGAPGMSSSTGASADDLRKLMAGSGDGGGDGS